MNSLCFTKQDKAVCSNSLKTKLQKSSFGLRMLAICLTLAAALWASAAVAQSSSALTAVYGRGVHAYFAGNSTQAEQHFTEVIQAGSSDPRPYYFRAVLRLQQGRQFEAENDMRIGAAYEARNPGVQHAIGRALQRVQGPSRRTLEKFRRQAKLDRVQQGRQQNLQRYENLRQRAPNLLRQPAAIPLNQPVGPPQLPAAGSATKLPAASGSGTMQPLPGSGAKPQPLPAQNLATPQPAAPTPAPALGSGAKADEADPFGTPAPVTPAADDIFGSGTTAAPTPAPAATAEPDPFGALPAPAEEADPFGESTTPPADDSDPFGESTTPAAEEPADAAPADDDPFGASEEDSAPAESDDSDPFGESSDGEMESEEAASGDDPFGESSSEESDDPFGESSSEDSEDPFGDSSSDADEDDPFGESSDSGDEPPADDDPFGESMEDENSSEGDSDSEEEPVDEDDPFGPLGGVGPATGGNAFVAQPTLTRTSSTQAAAPGGQLFFALGQWLGSQGNAMAKPADGNTAVALADFQLGPTEPGQTQTASAEIVSEEEDPFAADPFGDDPFGAE